MTKFPTKRSFYFFDTQGLEVTRAQSVQRCENCIDNLTILESQLDNNTRKFDLIGLDLIGLDWI